MGKVFLNDKIVDSSQAGINASDSGFLYGMGIFETMRSCNGKVFRIDDHMERLFNSAKALSINNPYVKEFLTDAIDKTLQANQLKDARIRLTLSNGPMDTSNNDGINATLLISAINFEPYPKDFYEKGVRVVLSEFRQNPTDPTTGHKTLNFFARLLALNTAHKKRAAEALWFTVDGKLAEGCVSNVFIVKDSAIYTPPLNTPVMGGIMRKTVLEIAESQSIKAQQSEITIKELLAADEVFITNVVMGTLPVVGVEAHTVGDGKIGTVTKKLIECVNKKITSLS